MSVLKMHVVAHPSLQPPDPLQSPERGSPESAIFETKQMDFWGARLEPI